MHLIRPGRYVRAASQYKHSRLTLFPSANPQSLSHTAMVRLSTYLAATAALAINAQAESMYSKKSGVLNLAGTDYDRLIAKSNYTSVRCMLREHLVSMS